VKTLNTLIIDTSHKLLVVGLARDSKVVVSKQTLMAKRQSESLIPFIEDALREAKLSREDIDEIVLTSGPGSYTGLRIGMTFVKVFALTKEVNVYTINTLLSISGTQDAFVMLDARGKRVFGGFTQKGNIEDERIYQLDEISTIDAYKLGDLSLIGLEDNYGDVIDNIMSVKDKWKRVDNIDTLVPDYTS
jgi:tRNA threonylcarbamoyladenosine biosynthesis protein TsaB